MAGPEALILVLLFAASVIAAARPMSEPDDFGEYWLGLLFFMVPFGVVWFAFYLSDMQRVAKVSYNSVDFIVNGPIQLLVFLVTYIALPIYGLFLFVVMLAAMPRFFKMLDFMFRKHPVEPHVLPALRDDQAIDTRTVGRILMDRANETDRPVYQEKTDAKKARAMTNRLEAETDLAKAILKRERARAALKDADEEVREAGRRTEKRR